MPKLIIHAGFPKSGTTALQAAFRANPDVLLESNITYPASQNDAHHTAAAALVGRSIGWNQIKRDMSVWEEFVNSFNKTRFDTILISSEFFSAAGLKQIKRIRRDFHDLEIQVFFTIRPLSRVIPSIYQQNLKKGSVLTYPEWISKKFINEFGELRQTPRLINHGKIIKAWVEVFGANSVSLVIADSTNPEMLYKNVESLLGISELKPVETRALNRSLTVRECEILRRVNLNVKGKWSWYEYRKFIRQGYVKELTGTQNKYGDGNFSTPEFLLDVISKYVGKQIIDIQSLGIEILGDLNLLGRVDRPSRGDFVLDDQQIAQEFKVIMGNLNWRRSRHRLKPTMLLRRLKSKLFRNKKNPPRK